MTTRDKLRWHFRNWWNDYLTVDRYAEDYGWSRNYTWRVLSIGRKLHNRRAVELTELISE